MFSCLRVKYGVAIQIKDIFLLPKAKTCLWGGEMNQWRSKQTINNKINAEQDEKSATSSWRNAF